MDTAPQFLTNGENVSTGDFAAFMDAQRELLNASRDAGPLTVYCAPDIFEALMESKFPAESKGPFKMIASIVRCALLAPGTWYKSNHPALTKPAWMSPGPLPWRL